MKCSRCGSERSYQFEAGASDQPRPGAHELPLVCRDCGLLSIDGVAVALPEQLESAAKSLAEVQDSEARRAREELKSVDGRIDAYMSNFYRIAYLEGFFRAIAFFRHNVKEGRLVRLRELWKEAEPCWRVSGGPEGQGVIMSPEAYTEFEQLLLLTAVPGDTNAKSPQNQQASKSKDQSRVS